MPPDASTGSQAFLQLDWIARQANAPAGIESNLPGLAAVPSGQTIVQALQALEIALPQAAIALVNGQTCDLSYVLQPGDQVHFLLQISGG